MNREEFLRRLERLLSDIPESERREAMEYYQNYFEDAGPENEASIIEELGSPQEVASSIKKNLFGDDYENYSFVKEEQKKTDTSRRNTWIVVLLILTFPLWIGLLAGAFGILVAGIACLFALAVGVVALVGAFVIVGVVFAGIGIAQMCTGFPAVGLILFGIGMLFLAVSVLGLIIIVYAVGRMLPWILRAVVRICKRPFQKRGASI